MPKSTVIELLGFFGHMNLGDYADFQCVKCGNGESANAKVALSATLELSFKRMPAKSTRNLPEQI